MRGQAGGDTSWTSVGPMISLAVAEGTPSTSEMESAATALRAGLAPTRARPISEIPQAAVELALLLGKALPASARPTRYQNRGFALPTDFSWHRRPAETGLSKSEGGET